MSEDERAEFSVCQFFPDGTYEYICRWVSVREACVAFKRAIIATEMLRGEVARVIITDGGDCTNAEWKFGEGLTYPTPEILAEPERWI